MSIAHPTSDIGFFWGVSGHRSLVRTVMSGCFLPLRWSTRFGGLFILSIMIRSKVAGDNLQRTQKITHLQHLPCNMCPPNTPRQDHTDVSSNRSIPLVDRSQPWVAPAQNTNRPTRRRLSTQQPLTACYVWIRKCMTGRSRSFYLVGGRSSCLLVAGWWWPAVLNGLFRCRRVGEVDHN